MDKVIKSKGLFGTQLLIFESLPSTNDWAIENISQCKHGTTVQAINQIAGKGRFQREWISPKNQCLTISVVLDPNRSTHDIRSALTQVAALAIKTTFKEFSIDAMLKWPNDVLINSKKTAGILAESVSDYIVLGMGLNINTPKGSLEDKDFIFPATSMQAETGKTYDIEKVRTKLLMYLEQFLIKTALEGTGFIKELWSDSDFLKDQEIEVHSEKETRTGRYSGLDQNGQLCLLDSNGETHHLWSGDVSLRDTN